MRRLMQNGTAGVLVIALIVGLYVLPPVPKAEALTCGAGSVYQTTRCIVYLTSGTSWTVPNDWNNASNTVEAIGGGGGGADGSSGGTSGSGGGGGGYAKITDTSFTDGNSVTYSIGSGGARGSSGGTGGDSYFNGTSCAGASVCAKGASGGTTSSGGAGGAAGSGVGSTTYSGGGGGTGNSSGGGGGGGGGAGPSGGGSNGGGGGSNGGGGGGGNGGGSSTAGTTATSNTGGAGGSASDGTAGGAAGTNGSNGSGGGGGNGGSSGSTAGVGGAGNDWDSSHGSGGGGGGGGGATGFFGGASTGSAGGHYGAGGGGGGGYSGLFASSGNGANGFAGIVVIIYTPIITPTVTTSAASSVSVTHAALNGSVTNDGNADATQHGFAYSIDSTLSNAVSTTTLGVFSGTGSFNQTASGLLGNTTYYFRAYSQNSSGIGYGAILNFTTVAPTTPDPDNFSSAPAPASASSVAMTAQTATNGSDSIQYYFSHTLCGSNDGAGGSDSGWQIGTSYTDSGLQPNQCYGYTVTAMDATLSAASATSTASTTYTFANIPNAPTLSNTSGTVFTVSGNDNGNPASNPTTLFAAEVSTSDVTWNNKYIDQYGNPSASPVWLTGAQLSYLTVTGLTPLTAYTVAVKAENQNDVATSFGSGSTITTLNANGTTPRYIRLLGIRLRGVRLL